MPWIPQAAYSRGERLGPSRLNQVASNAALLRRVFAAEHAPTTGLHNTLRIPRVVRRIVSTTVYPASSVITSVTNPSAGTMVVNLASGGTSDMRVMVNLRHQNGKPHTASVTIDSGTQFTIRARSLTSALGSGNTWGDYDLSKGLDVAVFDQPVATGDFESSEPSAFRPGAYLDPATWDDHCENLEELRALQVTHHDPADGKHKVNEIAYAYGDIHFASPSTYSKLTSEGLGTLTRNSIGDVSIALSAGYETAFAAFAMPHARSAGASQGRIRTAHCVPFGAGAGNIGITTYEYSQSGNSWALADGGFFLAVHREP